MTRPARARSGRPAWTAGRPPARRRRRKLAEIAADGAVDSLFYDPAGNVLRRKTGRGHVLTMTYDALGRVAERIVPSVSFAPDSQPVGSETWRFPRYGADGAEDVLEATTGIAGLTIPADTARFTYDWRGGIRTATNRDAAVTRRYFPGGALKADTIRIREYAGATVAGSRHVYGIEYGYDRNGRRAWIKHPASIAPEDARGKMVRAKSRGDSTVNRYSALGALAGGPRSWRCRPCSSSRSSSAPGWVNMYPRLTARRSPRLDPVGERR